MVNVNIFARPHFIVPICQFMGTHSYESSQIYNFELDVDNAVLSLYSLSE